MPNRILDTFAEAFDGVYARVLITADDLKTLRRAAMDVASSPSGPIGRTEAGIEKWVSKDETPDGCVGVIVQVWSGFEEGKSFGSILTKFEKEFSYRIRQDVLVKPFTAVFDAHASPEGKIDAMERIGHCGDGYEWEEDRYGRRMIVVPTLVPDFQIERFIGYGFGVTGGNFWYMCRRKETVMEAGRKALKAIDQVEGVIAPYGICAAGSKVETKFPWIGGTTNHPYCPSLREKLGKESKVPYSISFIPEVVIHGVSLDAVKNAMKAGIEAIMEMDDVVMISAGNYGGKLGKYKIFLRQLFQ